MVTKKKPKVKKKALAERSSAERLAKAKRNPKKAVEKKPVKRKPSQPKKVQVEKKVIREDKPTCTDKHCPIHGSLKTRGREFVGKVITDKMSKTVRVEWPRQSKMQKYERFLKKRSRVHAHNPPCISAKVSDKVRIAECRPISKTKTFVVMEVIKLKQ